MAETSWPTAAGGGVTDATYEYLMGAMTGDGLVGTPTLSTLIYADATGRHVKIRTARYAVIRGFIWWSGLETITLPIAANASGKTRVDRVVLRLDRSTFTIRAVVIAGTPATKPLPPAYQQTLPPGKYFDLPVATVIVPSGATGIAGSNVTHTGWYLAEPPLAGVATAYPASTPGRILRDATRKRTYIGTEVGGWTTLTYDSGWIAMDPPKYWTGSFKARQKNGWVTIQVDLKWGGSAAIGKTKDVQLYTLGATFRPSLRACAPMFVANPASGTATAASVSTAAVSTAGKTAAQIAADKAAAEKAAAQAAASAAAAATLAASHTRFMTADTNGKIILQTDAIHELRKNCYVYGQLTYPLVG